MVNKIIIDNFDDELGRGQVGDNPCLIIKLGLEHYAVDEIEFLGKAVEKVYVVDKIDDSLQRAEARGISPDKTLIGRLEQEYFKTG